MPGSGGIGAWTARGPGTTIGDPKKSRKPESIVLCIVHDEVFIGVIYGVYIIKGNGACAQFPSDHHNGSSKLCTLVV